MMNKIRALYESGKPVSGTRIWSVDPFLSEVLASLHAFDYLEFVAEYAAFSQADLENMARSAELHGMACMIKVDFQNRGYVAQKAVASGFEAVMFSDHRTAQEVRESVRLLKPETPEDGGLFGFPNRRFTGTRHRVTQLEHAERLRQTVLCFMIEKREALENIDEICSVDGVDMVQFGPSDYSLSGGYDRSGHEEELLRAERRMIEAALRHGVRPRCEIASAGQAQYYIDLGVKDFSVGDQMKVLESFWSSEGKKIKKIVGED